jgi:hypothetical protein
VTTIPVISLSAASCSNTNQHHQSCQKCLAVHNILN